MRKKETAFYTSRRVRLSCLGRRQKQTAIDLETLIEFFLCCKSNQEYTEFQFFTGIMRIQTLNLGSGSNYLKDVTMSKKYATLLGFTEEEIKQYFPTRLKALSDRLSCTETQTIEKLRKYYSGYKFSQDTTKSVYNPFSVIDAFKNKEIKDVWMDGLVQGTLISIN